ncbi:MAG: cobalamin/Fe(3+)-siderophore ABC transporter ATP-binding protein [Hyphomicrobiales bacterium]|nr:MAG: cobalamin/Fe(3+)-siderophore ABC transporter ATP-binding protein [Hyphomicrobiales bacterium]
MSEENRLNAHNVTLAYGERLIIDDLSVSIPDGKVTVIIGPNACGKSTLLRALARLLKPQAGEVMLDGVEIGKIPTRKVAKRLGLLPQTPIAPQGILVSDLVSRGRTPHQSAFQQWSEVDEEAVLDAMQATQTLDLADRRIEELSGGQRQRVWIAMALAQQTELLLLDEPTTFLDLPHQIEVLNLVRKLNRQQGRTIVVVLHDLNLACRYADHIVAMREGAIVEQGVPKNVITVDVMLRVFGLKCDVITDHLSGTPMVVPAVEDYI